MKKYRITYLAVLTAVFFCGLWGGNRLVPGLLALLVIVPVCSGISLYLSVGKLSLSLDGRHSCPSGQPMEITLKLKYSFLRPAGNVQVGLTCENLVFGTVKHQPYLLQLGRGRHHEYGISLDTSVCGRIVVRIREMACYDLLGLFSYHKPMEEEFACMVYPYEARMYVSLGKNREREQPGDIYDGKKSGTDVSEVFGLREYREGDPLQSIHWKLSGKWRQLIVREFGRPVNYHTLLLLSPALSYGGQKAEESVITSVFDLGVSLSHALLNQNIAHFVGYLTGCQLCCIPVDSTHSYEDMLLNLMGQPIRRSGDEALISFVNQQLYRQYTKVVYVTGAVNEAVAQNLSVLVDLTVLQASQGQSGYLMDGGGYGTVRVSIEKIRSMEHIIPL